MVDLYQITKNYKIFEARSNLGGTWSLFKYPGIRSDSDMYTFGYSFKTWDNPKSFADAPSILNYLKEAVEEYNIEDKISYNSKLETANFNSPKSIWEISISINGKIEMYKSRYIFFCTGYYCYDVFNIKIINVEIYMLKNL